MTSSKSNFLRCRTELARAPEATSPLTTQKSQSPPPHTSVLTRHGLTDTHWKKLLPRFSWKNMIWWLLFPLAALFWVLFLPIPSPIAIRDWAQSYGAAGWLVFLCVHILATITPLPRTIFTLASGMLFGPMRGLAVAIIASTISAALAFLLTRRLAANFVQSRISHPLAQYVQNQLSSRGWLAVGSLRLIAPVPFAILNYLCGLSTVRFIPYTLASMIGLLPGTAAIVLLGNAAAHFDPRFMIVSACNITLGVCGLILNAKLGRRLQQKMDAE